jgi:hypothetical protein
VNFNTLEYSTCINLIPVVKGGESALKLDSYDLRDATQVGHRVGRRARNIAENKVKMSRVIWHRWSF